MTRRSTGPQPSGRPPVLMATVDSLPQPYQVLGLVDTAMAAPSGVVPTARLMARLGERAAAMGADAVIGIRLSQLTLPGSSRIGLFGRVIEHRGTTVVAVALGTAVRLVATAAHAHSPAPSSGRPR